MRFYYLCFLLSAELCITVLSIALDPILLWPPGAPAPGENGFVCGPEKAVNTSSPWNWQRRFYNVSIPTLSAYLVQNGTGAAVVVAPGGGYDHLAYDDEGVRVAYKLNQMGVSALVLKYRVPRRPDAAGQPWASAQLMDAQRAMGLARQNAGAWGFNASRLGFLGFSAGGHLTAHISTVWQARNYPRQDAADDLPCRPDFSMLLYPWMLLAGNSRSSTELSPSLPVTRDTPPAFVAQNLDDTTAFPENSLVYTRALHLAGVPPGSLHMYPSGGHGFGVCAEVDPTGGFLQCCEWPFHAQRFLQNLGFAPGWPQTFDWAAPPQC